LIYKIIYILSQNIKNKIFTLLSKASTKIYSNQSSNICSNQNNVLLNRSSKNPYQITKNFQDPYIKYSVDLKLKDILKQHINTDIFKFKNKNSTNPFIKHACNIKFKNNIMTKWNHYFEIYDIFFEKFYNKDITLMEFGVANGGSIDMWKTVFGKNSKIIGVDINPICKVIENENIDIFIGDQEDRNFLKSMMNSIDKVDLIVEDGGHESNQRINTFEIVFPYLNNNGIFLIEDLHTSYFKSFGGGFKKKGSFIEFIKALIDNFIFKKNKNFKQLGHDNNMINEIQLDKYQAMIKSIHLFDSVITFEKSEKMNNILDSDFKKDNLKFGWMHS